MFYFIPAWYDPDQKWGLSSQRWYHVHKQPRFDDTLNQLKLFKGEKVELLVLNYAPHLRHFLKRNALFDIQYYSLFDQFQGIEERESRPLAVSDFIWPNDVEFIHTPFLITILREGELYANIELGEEGYILWVDFFEANQKTRTYLIDDRGFLSSIVYYEQGKRYYQEYLDRSGVWCLRSYEDERVEINPYKKEYFEHIFYPSMADLMQEYLSKIEIDDSEDALVIAAHADHNQLLYQTFRRAKKTLSFFGERYTAEDEEMISFLEQSTAVITDTGFKEQELKSLAQKYQIGHQHIYHLPPIDTRLELGKSQRLLESRLYLLIDSLTREEMEEFILLVIEKSVSYPLELILASYQKSIQEIYDWLDSFEHLNWRVHFECQKPNAVVDPEQLIVGKKKKPQIYLVQIRGELDLLESLTYARIIIDLSLKPNIFVQIMGISSGLPQINRQETHYIRHQENGYIIHGLQELGHALDYYLVGLKNWNISLVKSVEQINAYASGELLKRWKPYLEGRER